jgi:endothelin-converting enzyme/putative endopeptidase
VGVAVPFGIYAAEDLHEPSKTIAHVYASGLGMPDRDYYLKPEPRFVEARAKYLEHVAKMFELAGTPADQAKKNAETVFAFEKRLVEASFDNV